MSDAIGDELEAFEGVELSVFVEEVVHHHTPQLGHALLHAHTAVKVVDFLFNAVGGAGCYGQQQA
jgi:hypothetical protein